MDRSVKEKFQEIDGHPFNNEETEYQQGEAPQGELPKPTRGRKRRANKNSTKLVNVRWSWEFDARLERFRADRSAKEHRKVDRAEVILQAVDEFLTKEGY